MNLSMMLKSLKEENRVLSHKATSWSNYLWSKMRIHERQNTQVATSEWFLSQAFAKGKKTDFVSDNDIVDAKDFSGEFFSRLYENSSEEENPTKWASNAHEVLDNLPEMEGLIATIDGDADIAAACTDELIKDAARDIAKFRMIEEPDEEQKSKFRRRMKKALSRVKSKGEEYSAIKGNSSEFFDGDSEPEDLQERILFMNRISNSPDFKELLNQMGRMVDIMNSIPSKSKDSDQFEFSGLTYGDDIGRLSPVDTMDLASPETEDLFYYKYITSSLSIEERNGIKDLGRGSLVVLLDTSGSMSGDNIFWAKCLAGAVLKGCIDENRDCVIITFNGHVKNTFVLNKNGDSYFYHHTSRKNTEKLNKMRLFRRVMDESCRGGTCFESPFKEAIFHLKKDSDIIFLTDGHASELSKETSDSLNLLKEDGLRVWTILFDEQSTTKTIKSLSNEIIKISTREWLTEDGKNKASENISRTIKNALEKK